MSIEFILVVTIIALLAAVEIRFFWIDHLVNKTNRALKAYLKDHPEGSYFTMWVTKRLPDDSQYLPLMLQVWRWDYLLVMCERDYSRLRRYLK